MNRTNKRIEKFILLIYVLSYFVLSSLYVDRVSLTYFSHTWEFYFLLLGGVGVLFSLFRFIQVHRFSILELVVLLVLTRGVLYISPPNLSDDVYRFYWDAYIQDNGIDVYQYKPSELVDHNLFNDDIAPIYNKLNSKDYYSVYPPVYQWIFKASYFIGNQSLIGFTITYRSIILLFEFILLLFLYLKRTEWHIKQEWLISFIILPVFVLEGVGNLHIEIIVLFLSLLSVHLIERKFAYIGGILLGLAVAVKLYPLIFIPLFIFYFRPIRGIWFMTGLASILTLIGFYHFTPETYSNMMESILLYFGTFEFNASIYYMLRAIGYQYNDYNMIADITMYLSGISALLIILISLIKGLRKELFKGLFYVSLVYILLQATVHPWYIIYLTIFGIILKKKWVLAWSVLIYISYHVYLDNTYTEYLLFTLIEYTLVILFYLYENVGFKKFKSKRKFKVSRKLT